MKKPLTLLFRAVVMLAFVFSLIYVIQFFALIGKVDDGSISMGAIKSWTVFYKLYLILAIVAVVLSIVCYKTTSGKKSFFRTFFLIIAALCSFLGKKVMDFFSSAVSVKDVSSFNSALDKYSDLSEGDMMMFFVSWVGVVILLILAITSLVNFISTMKKKEDAE